MSRSSAWSGPSTRRSGSHARIDSSRAQGRRLVPYAAHTPGAIVLYPDHAVQTLPDLVDVGDDDHLREAIPQLAQQSQDVLPAPLVERPEYLVQHEQRERLPRPLRDHLRDRQSQHQIGEVLFSPRNHRLRDAAVDHRQRVVLAQVRGIVTPIRQIGEEPRCQLGDLRPHGGVQLGPQLGVRPVELVVEPPFPFERVDVLLARPALGDAPVHLRDDLFRARQLASRFHRRQLRLAHDDHRAVVALFRLAELLLREPVGHDRLDQLLHLLLATRQQLLGLLRFLHQRLGQARAGLEGRRFLDQRLEGGELGAHGVEPGAVVARGLRRQPGLELREPRRLLVPLRHGACPLLGLRLQLSGVLRSRATHIARGIPFPLGLGDRLRGLGELLRALLEEVAIERDLLELAIEQTEHRLVFLAERALTGGTGAFGAELVDSVALLFHVAILLAQLLALRLGILAIPRPRRPLLLDLPLEREQLLGDLLDLTLGARARRRCAFELGDALVAHGGCPLELRDLRLRGPALGGLLLQSLEPRALRLQLLQRLQLRREPLQLGARRQRFSQLSIQTLEVLARRFHRVLRHRALALERADPVAPHFPFFPSRLLARQRVFGLAPRFAGRLRSGAAPLQPLQRGGAVGLELALVRQPRFQTLQLGGESVADLPYALLRQLQPLVAEYARQERRPLDFAERRHHRQLFLAREIGVEELVVRHAEHAAQPLGDRFERVRHDLAVLPQLRAVEVARDGVLVRSQREVEGDLHARPARGAVPPDRVLVAAHRLHAVDRPGDRFEQRRFPRPVGTDDAGDPGPKLDLGLGELPEVLEPQPLQLHQAASPSGPACSRYSTPVRTNSSRGMSASSSRRDRKSRSVSGSVWRRDGAPLPVW